MFKKLKKIMGQGKSKITDDEKQDHILVQEKSTGGVYTHPTVNVDLVNVKQDSQKISHDQGRKRRKWRRKQGYSLPAVESVDTNWNVEATGIGSSFRSSRNYNFKERDSSGVVSQITQDDAVLVAYKKDYEKSAIFPNIGPKALGHSVADIIPHSNEKNGQASMTNSTTSEQISVNNDGDLKDNSDASDTPALPSFSKTRDKNTTNNIDLFYEGIANAERNPKSSLLKTDFQYGGKAKIQKQPQVSISERNLGLDTTKVCEHRYGEADTCTQHGPHDERTKESIVGWNNEYNGRNKNTSLAFSCNISTNSSRINDENSDPVAKCSPKMGNKFIVMVESGNSEISISCNKEDEGAPPNVQIDNEMSNVYFDCDESLKSDKTTKTGVPIAAENSICTTSTKIRDSIPVSNTHMTTKTHSSYLQWQQQPTHNKEEKQSITLNANANSFSSDTIQASADLSNGNHIVNEVKTCPDSLQVCSGSNKKTQHFNAQTPTTNNDANDKGALGNISDECASEDAKYKFDACD